MYKAIETADPYPVKAYICFRHDPLMAFPDPDRLRQVFAKLDLLVSVTFTWSDTAWFSDVVLPLSPYLERESVLASKNGLKPYFKSCTTGSVLGLLALVLSLGGAAPALAKQEVIVFHAGSLTVPFAEVEKRFTAYGLQHSQPVAVWLIFVCLGLFLLLRWLSPAGRTRT